MNAQKIYRHARITLSLTNRQQSVAKVGTYIRTVYLYAALPDVYRTQLPMSPPRHTVRMYAKTHLKPEPPALFKK